jgi:hypothetical protein
MILGPTPGIPASKYLGLSFAKLPNLDLIESSKDTGGCETGAGVDGWGTDLLIVSVPPWEEINWLMGSPDAGASCVCGRFTFKSKEAALLVGAAELRFLINSSIGSIILKKFA